MSEVKRYEMKTTYRGHESWDSLEEDQDGGYVSYEDYAALEAKCAALAAENAVMKAFGDKLYSMYKGLEASGGGFHDEQSIPYQQAALDAAISEFEKIKTTATDAFLDEVRAQGVESAISQALMDEIPVNRMQFISRMTDFAAQLRKVGEQK